MHKYVLRVILSKKSCLLASSFFLCPAKQISRCYKMGTAASTRPQPKGPQPTGQTTAVPTAFVVAEKYEEPAVAGVLVQHPSAEPIVHGVPVAFSPTAAAVHTGAVVHTATTAHAGAAAHPADPGEIPVNVNTMKSVEWICIEANT